MKIGILTFHASHNYGSMLQNYALQQILLEMGHEVETINLRTPMQKEMYDFFMPIWKLMDKKRFIYSILYLPWRKQIKKKHSLFEQFLSEKLFLSKEVNDHEALAGLPPYDAYIIGSDQCWNMKAKDFDWSYLLGFTPEDSVRLSYAISMGPWPIRVAGVCKDKLPRMKELLGRFSGISVRDEDTKTVVDAVTAGAMESSIHVDPSLLLDKQAWSRLAPQEPIVKGKYVFIYNPYWIESVSAQAREVGRLAGLPVVTSNPTIKGNLKYGEFRKVFDAGPLEFLNLVMNAEYVVGRSFHLMAFSILLHKKFIAVSGMGDSRIRQLLKMTGLECCATENGNVPEVMRRLATIDFQHAEDQLSKERQRSILWLKEHLRK